MVMTGTNGILTAGGCCGTGIVGVGAVEDGSVVVVAAVVVLLMPTRLSNASTVSGMSVIDTVQVFTSTEKPLAGTHEEFSRTNGTTSEGGMLQLYLIAMFTVVFAWIGGPETEFTYTLSASSSAYPAGRVGKDIDDVRLWTENS